MSSLPLDIEQIIAVLMSQVVVGKAHLAVAKGLAESDPVVLNAASTFFAMTIDSHIFCAQMFGAKLFDKTRGALTMETLLSRAEQESRSAKCACADEVSHAVAHSRQVITSLAAPLKALTNRRNFWLAHTDPRTITDPNKMVAAARVSFPDLQKIFVETGNLLNEFSRLLRDVTGVMELVHDDDYQTVIEYVSKVKCQQIREYEAEFGPVNFPRPKGCE